MLSYLDREAMEDKDPFPQRFQNILFRHASETDSCNTSDDDVSRPKMINLNANVPKS